MKTLSLHKFPEQKRVKRRNRKRGNVQTVSRPRTNTHGYDAWSHRANGMRTLKGTLSNEHRDYWRNNSLKINVMLVKKIN